MTLINLRISNVIRSRLNRGSFLLSAYEEGCPDFDPDGGRDDADQGGQEDHTEGQARVGLVKLGKHHGKNSRRHGGLQNDHPLELQSQR